MAKYQLDSYGLSPIFYADKISMIKFIFPVKNEVKNQLLIVRDWKTINPRKECKEATQQSNNFKVMVNVDKIITFNSRRFGITFKQGILTALHVMIKSLLGFVIY